MEPAYSFGAQRSRVTSYSIVTRTAIFGSSRFWRFVPLRKDWTAPASARERRGNTSLSLTVEPPRPSPEDLTELIEGHRLLFVLLLQLRGTPS